jgi:hypothetical protein
MTMHYFVSAAILAAKNMAVVQHPPSSPHLAPCDFFSFMRIKKQLKGTVSRISLKFRKNH